MNCSPSASFAHGIFQARTLEWVAISFSGDLHDTGIEPTSLASLESLASECEFVTTVPPGKP